MISAVPTVAAMSAYALADPVGARIVSLAQNESAFLPSPAALAAGKAALASSHLYPDPDWSELRAAIAAVHAVAPHRILCGAGSMELIGALVRAFAGPGDEVLGSAYGYAFLETASQQAGARHVAAPEIDFRVSVDAMLAAVTPRTRLVFLCNPGNPTGTRLDNPEILRLRNALPADCILVVDQAYGEFDDQDHAAVFALADRGDTVVLRTFSKAYALAGARVGWGVFPGAIGREARKLMNPNNVSGVSQAMAVSAMRDQGHMRRIVQQTVAIRTAFVATLAPAGYRIPQAHANFVLIPFRDPAAARHADDRLRAAGVMMRGMAGYGLAQCLRATVATEDIMQLAAEVLVDIAGGGSDAGA